MALTLPRYCLIGSRPVRALATPDGGMTVQALDWETGEFAPALEYTERVVMGHGEVDYLSEAEFDAAVAATRARIFATR